MKRHRGMDKRSPKAADKPDRANHGRWKWFVGLLGGVVLIAMGLAPPAVGIGASTTAIAAAASEDAADHSTAGPLDRKATVSEPEPAGHAADPDTAVQKGSQAQSEPEDLDTFTPSETIEADQGVDFPYDI